MPVDVEQQIRSAYIWTAAASALKQSLGLVLSVILARLLNPRDYGLVGMVTVIVQIIQMVQDMGLGRGIVYFRDDESTYPTYFTSCVAMGAIMTGLLAAAAPLVAGFYENPGLVPLVRACSLSLLLSSLRLVPNAVLMKNLDFRTSAAAETATSFIGLSTAITLAYYGFGVWSLVANLLTSSTLQTAVLLWFVRPHFTLRPQFEVVWRAVRYGLPLTGSNLLWQLYDNSDFLIVGKVLGAEALGVYSLAFRLATMVNSRIGSIVNSVSFPAFAALRESISAVREHWLTATSRLAFLSFAILAVFAIGAEDIVRYVYGAKWMAVVTPLRLLCVVGLLRTVTPLTLGLVSAQGRPDVNFKYTLLNCILIPGGVFVGCHLGGLAGVGWAWVLLFPFSVVYLMRVAFRVMDMEARVFLMNLLPATKAGIAAAACMLALHFLLPDTKVRLIVSLIAAGLSVLAIGFRTEEIRSTFLPYRRATASPEG